MIEKLKPNNSLSVKHGKPPHGIAIPLRSLLIIHLEETEGIRVDSNCDIDELIIALLHCECIAKDRKPILTTTPTGLIDKPCLIRRVDVVFGNRSEEHTSELQSLMRISYAVFCLKKKTHTNYTTNA